MCVRTMSQTDSIRMMMTAVKIRPDSLGLAAEAMNRMFEKQNSELVAQVGLRCSHDSQNQSIDSLKTFMEISIPF